MIELKGTILIPISEQKIALPALRRHISATRKEPANLLFNVDQDKTNAEIFHVHEQFVDMSGFERHQKLGKKRRWGQISRAFNRDFHIAEI